MAYSTDACTHGTCAHGYFYPHPDGYVHADGHAHVLSDADFDSVRDALYPPPRTGRIGRLPDADPDACPDPLPDACRNLDGHPHRHVYSGTATAGRNSDSVRPAPGSGRERRVPDADPRSAAPYRDARPARADADQQSRADAARADSDDPANPNSWWRRHFFFV